MNIDHISYFYPLFIVAVIFYFLGRYELKQELNTKVKSIFKKLNNKREEYLNEEK